VQVSGDAARRGTVIVCPVGSDEGNAGNESSVRRAKRTRGTLFYMGPRLWTDCRLRFAVVRAYANRDARSREAMVRLESIALGAAS